MALSIIIDHNESTEEHARKAVRKVLEFMFDPYAPRLPEASEVYMRHYCSEGHHFWAPLSYHNGLCAECRAVPEIRERWVD